MIRSIRETRSSRKSAIRCCCSTSTSGTGAARRSEIEMPYREIPAAWALKWSRAGRALRAQLRKRGWVASNGRAMARW
ncbi:hypothetical protein ACFFX0_25705 [Citricoccus parietis]|uniref:Uncharacterized protein n=1 Tax=Citricoccus parietis TaxID=592307 RepID=A0ABV5G623_9MICC